MKTNRNTVSNTHAILTPTCKAGRSALGASELASLAAGSVFRVNIDRDEAVIISRPVRRSPSDRCDDVR